MDYSFLGDDQRQQILQQRLAQYEAEYFQHSLNCRLLAASGDSSESTACAIAEAEAAMATLDAAHAGVLAELASI